MFNIEYQLRLIGVFAKILIGLVFMLIVGVGFGASTLIEHQKWVEHTNSVLNQIEIAESAYSNADYAGRNQIVHSTNIDLTPQREKALNEIANLRSKISDNNEQINNIAVLKSAIENRFKVQDEQIATIERSSDSISYKLDTVVKSIQFTEAVEKLFAEIKITEYNLLQNNRMPRLVSTQWQAVYFIIALLLILIGIIVLLVFSHKKLLKRMLVVGEKMDLYLEISEADEKFQQDFHKFAEFIKNESSVLPIEVSRSPNH